MLTVGEQVVSKGRGHREDPTPTGNQITARERRTLEEGSEGDTEGGQKDSSPRRWDWADGLVWDGWASRCLIGIGGPD